MGRSLGMLSHDLLRRDCKKNRALLTPAPDENIRVYLNMSCRYHEQGIRDNILSYVFTSVLRLASSQDMAPINLIDFCG